MYRDMHSEFSRRRAKQRLRSGITLGVMLLVILVVAALALTFRLDFASGSHRILPTAVDTDWAGNYKVYYRTTEFTKDVEESVYYIAKSDVELAEQMRECVKRGQFVMVYYDSYIGFKGVFAPREAPITRIELID